MLVDMAVVAKDISKAYGDQNVLTQWNCTIPSHKITCLMGPSGCGKTTFLHIMLGLIKPESGTIYGLENQIIKAIFQENRLCNYLNSPKNISIVCSKKDRDLIKINNALKSVGLDQKDIIKPVSELSGGMQRRVAIVRALIPYSTMILMDEPFRGLDEDTKKKVVDFVFELTKDKTLLITTHDRSDVEMLNAELIEMV
ncbi:MAG: ATP-binding cassette domain-containing protein [Flexilinea sp.]